MYVLLCRLLYTSKYRAENPKLLEMNDLKVFFTFLTTRFCHYLFTKKNWIAVILTTSLAMQYNGLYCLLTSKYP
jgi:hypothetical protein